MLKKFEVVYIYRPQCPDKHSAGKMAAVVGGEGG
jgi:hypothetical protein